MMKPVTMAICRACWDAGEGYYLPVAEAGSECEACGYDGPPHRLVKRRLYICDEGCEEALGYLSAAALKHHQEMSHAGEENAG